MEKRRWRNMWAEEGNTKLRFDLCCFSSHISLRIDAWKVSYEINERKLKGKAKNIFIDNAQGFRVRRLWRLPKMMVILNNNEQSIIIQNKRRKCQRWSREQPKVHLNPCILFRTNPYLTNCNGEHISVTLK